MSYPGENVLVVRRNLFEQLGSFQGLSFEPEKYLNLLLSRGNNFFLSRAQAENDSAYKQIIPYVLLAFQDRVLPSFRGRKPASKRLLRKGRLAMAGHSMKRNNRSLAGKIRLHRRG